MNVTRILVAQHRAIEALFEAVARETRPHQRARAASRLIEELIAHMAGEEAVFYPAARTALGSLAGIAPLGPFTVFPGADGDGNVDDHFMLRAQLRRVLGTNVREPSFQPRFEALQLLFAHHVQAEENELFPRVEAILAAAKLESLGTEVIGSRPPVWVVTTEGHALIRSKRGGSTPGVRLPAVRMS